MRDGSAVALLSFWFALSQQFMGVMEKKSPALKLKSVPDDEFMASMCAVTSLVLALNENFRIIGLTETLPSVELSLTCRDQVSAVKGLHEVDSWHTL
jgi:hypothetical protein